MGPKRLTVADIETEWPIREANVMSAISMQATKDLLRADVMMTSMPKVCADPVTSRIQMKDYKGLQTSTTN